MIIYQMQVEKPLSMNPISAKPLFKIESIQGDVNNNSSATPGGHNIKKPLKNESYHRTINNPILGKKCTVIDSNFGNGYIYAGEKSLFFMFMTPDYKLEEKYFEIYDGFDFRNHISL